MSEEVGEKSKNHQAGGIYVAPESKTGRPETWFEKGRLPAKTGELESLHASKNAGYFSRFALETSLKCWSLQQNAGDLAIMHPWLIKVKTS